MSVSFQAAVNAYNNAAKITGSASGVDDKVSMGGVSGIPFAGVLKESVANVATSLHKAENVTASALVRQADIADVVTAVTNAEVTLKTVMAVRDRLVSAHQEIMRMPI